MKTELTLLASVTLLSLGSANAFATEVPFIEPPMVSIPAGSFLMGSDRGRENEKPVHKVSVPAFQMGKYEVTIGEFRKFVEATGYQAPQNCNHRIGPRWFGTGPNDGSWDKNSYSLSDFHPVVCVSRSDAINYANWLSEQTGKHYRLPTEAEWEYTVRAGTNTRYFFADEINSPKACQFANVSDLHANNMTEKLYGAAYGGYTIQACNDKEVLTSVVGLYEPNPFGVYDMLGNVVERLADCYADSYVGAPSDGSARKEENCQAYVARGGSWHWEAFESSRRMRMGDDFLAALEGFRLALDTGKKALPSEPGTTSFVNALAGAQQKAKKRHTKVGAYPATPQGLEVVSASAKQVTLKWHANDEKFVTGYRVIRQDPINNQQTVLATSIKQNHFVDSSPLASNGRYFVVALNGKNESMNSDIVDSQLSMVHVLPTKVQGEAFSQTTGASVYASGYEPDNDKIITAIDDKSATYTLQTDSEGRFVIKARVFHSGVDQSFELWLGDKKLATSELSGERGWKTVQNIVVDLPQGLHALTIKGKAAMFSINWLEFTPA